MILLRVNLNSNWIKVYWTVVCCHCTTVSNTRLRITHCSVSSFRWNCKQSQLSQEHVLSWVHPLSWRNQSGSKTAVQHVWLSWSGNGLDMSPSSPRVSCPAGPVHVLRPAGKGQSAGRLLAPCPGAGGRTQNPELPQQSAGPIPTRLPGDGDSRSLF